MSCFHVDVVEVQDAEWIKIGVDTGAGKTAWPQSVTNRKRIDKVVDVLVEVVDVGYTAVLGQGC